MLAQRPQAQRPVQEGVGGLQAADQHGRFQMISK
jgi:hypothetical protein